MMLTSEQTHARLIANGWHYEPTVTGESYSRDRHTIYIQHDGIVRADHDHDVSLRVDVILSALSCGIKVPGFVVVSEEDAVNADYWKGHALFLEKLLEVSGIRSLTFEEWLAKRSPEPLDSKLAAMIEGFLSSLTPSKEGS